jgi:hypothetical protein
MTSNAPHASLPMRFLKCCALIVMTTATLTSCTALGFNRPAGKLSIRSQSEMQTVLKGGFETGIYSFDEKNNLTVVLFQGPEENPAQAVTIRLFWQPHAGRTPIDPTATNAAINYVIFTGTETKQAGVYSGAGFVYPNDYPGHEVFHGSVWEADLVLEDSSAGFRDLLGQAKLTGNFTVRRDEAKVLELNRRLNIMVRERLGYPRFVAGEQTPAGMEKRQPGL